MNLIQNLQTNKITIRNIVVAVIASAMFTFCSNPNQVDQSKADQSLFLGLLAGQAQELNRDFILNGQWNEFTGNGTTSNTILTVSGKSGSKGLLLSDSSGFGGFSSCSILEKFEGYVLSTIHLHFFVLNSSTNFFFQYTGFNIENNRGKFTPIFSNVCLQLA